MKGLIEGKSDPYAIVRVGTQTFSSRVIDEDLNPRWGETYEVGQIPGCMREQELDNRSSRPQPVKPLPLPSR